METKMGNTGIDQITKKLSNFFSSRTKSYCGLHAAMQRAEAAKLRATAKRETGLRALTAPKYPCTQKSIKYHI
jgi:hypothetical protein